MGAALSFVPVSGGSTFTVDFETDLGLHLERFAGLFRSDGVRQRAQSGQQVTVVHEAWRVYEVRFNPVTWPPAGNPEAGRLQWLHAWMSWAQRGGRFTFARDASKTSVTALNGAQSQNDTTWDVDDDAGFAEGDQVFVEDLDDPTVYEVGRVSTTPAANVVTTNSGAVNAYADGSLFRHAEYFPTCELLQMDDVGFLERDAGRGVSAFDFGFTFRTGR